MEKNTYYLCDKVTMKIVKESDSIRDIAAEAGMSVSAAYSAVYNRAVSAGRYVVRSDKTYDPNESFEGKKHRPVVISGDGKKWYYVRSVEELAKQLGYAECHIWHVICSGRDLGEFRIRYAR